MVKAAHALPSVTPQHIGQLWLILVGQEGLVPCSEAQRTAEFLRFRVTDPVELNEGQRCRVCSHRPGESTPPGLEVSLNCAATVVQVSTRFERGGESSRVEVVLDQA